jgi:hypothetical protein
MSCEKYFCHSGLMSHVRAPTWILSMRIYLNIRAHNKFEMLDLFISINLCLEL